MPPKTESANHRITAIKEKELKKKLTCSSTETLCTFQRNSTIAKTNAKAVPIPNTKKTPPTFDKANSFDVTSESSPVS